ncbi:unnamed protein product [Lathyrus oleraceus]
MSITLNDASCLLYLPIRGELLDHTGSSKDETLEMMVDYRGVDPAYARTEMDRTRGTHARFEFLKKVYTYELQRVEHARGDDEQVRLHKAYVIRAYLLYLVGIVIFMDKMSLIYMSSTYGTSRISSGSMSTTGDSLVWSTYTRSYQRAVAGRQNMSHAISHH